MKAQLEFRVPARQVTVQDIPIINNTDRDWPIKVSLQNDNGNKNGNLFTIPNSMLKEFLVKKKQVSNLPLTFSPKWMCQAECRLELFNPLTNDKFEYEIKGYGEEPVAEDHIVIKCKARATAQKEIEIRNPFTDRDITYKVDTDVINASGEKTITIKAGKKAKYLLKVTPVLSGQYTGSITFTENED